MTTVHGLLRDMLVAVAEAIGEDLRQRLVFVGGCTTALFVTDEVVLEDVRATDDVDLIVDLAGYAAWAQLQEELRQRGFMESPEVGVICRMKLGDLKVDFMPDDESILGFSNQWYARGIETAVTHPLTPELNIRHLTPPLFLATKLEAYCGRGNDDPMMSHDLEDVLIVVDGRPNLVAEVQTVDRGIQDFIAEQLTALLDHVDFEGFLTGNIRGPEGRVDLVRRRLEDLAGG